MRIAFFIFTSRHPSLWRDSRRAISL